MQKHLAKLSFLAAALVTLTGCAGLTRSNEPDEKEDNKIRVKALIDGRDILFLKGDKIWIQHEAYDFPGKWAGQDLPVYINPKKGQKKDQTQKWHLKWNGNLSQQETILDSPPIPNYGTWDESNFHVDFHITGYGRAYVKQYPSVQNDYTLVIELDDIEPDGAHWYVVDISWDDDKDKNK